MWLTSRRGQVFKKKGYNLQCKRISEIVFLMPLDFLRVLSLERENPFFLYVIIQVLLNEMRRYSSIKTTYMNNCQTMIKMMLKRDKESVFGKLNPAGYPLIKIVVLVS